MLRVNPGFTRESGGFSQSPKIVFALALMACSLFWTGCAGFSQGSLPFPQTVLPSASLGTSYRDTLSVTGARPPYTFDVSHGQLPAGLSLDATTGIISGIPTRAGTSTFKITITGGAIGSGNGATSSASVVHAYALSVLTDVSPVTVQISPLDPSVAAGGKIQFSAAVSNTGNTAVNWSASAGTISSTGLFTAPTTSAPKSITITASSVAASTARASMPVTITSVNPVTVQISPLDPSVAAGGKIQFSAAVSNTSNTAVNWSASAGTISSAGLFTAPTSGSPASITITASSVSASTAKASTPVTITSVNPVTVRISPLDPSVAAGGKIQFSAAVSNTSNTAVSWRASAGTISSAGLFTAPSTGSPASITIAASSLAAASAQASTAVTVTRTTTPFVITTSGIPAAVEATPYSTLLTASGGQPPYQWRVVSGALPAGVQLNATTGTLSGSASQSGTFPFTVLSTDSASHSAQKSLSLLVSTSGKNCGPPAYECSRTDLSIVQVPTPPSVGILSGANAIVNDPDFGNRIVRITDANTDSTAGYKNRTYETTASGSADDNLWNTDSTLFIVQDTGAGGVPFSFNPSTFQAGRLYASSFPATNGMKLPGGGIWSRVNPNLLYTYSGTVINKYDFTDRTNPPSPQAVYDFTSSPNCLPAGFTATWYTVGGVSGDDSVLAMGYSNAGYQETGVYVVAYKVGGGCSVLNTQTGQVSGDWGSRGTINIADRWTIHNVKMSKDGNWMIISSNVCTASSCSQNPYFWQIGTTNVSSCGAGGYCGGHFTEGYTHFVNNYNSPLTSQVTRPFADSTVVSTLSTIFPAGDNIDQHQSWNNVDPGDSVPFLSTTYGQTFPFPAPWYNEIIGIAADGSGKTWRFAHNFITTRSLNFSTQWGIGTVSQDGKYFLFSSDWMGTLGSESGAETCTLGSDCRGDVFVLELK